MIDFTGRRVVITGAGGGVGCALTAGFSKAGAEVVACDVEGADLTGTHIAERHHFDLRDGAALARAVEKIVTGGVPAAVISNAGWSRADRLDQVSAEGLADEMDRNFTGAALFTQAFLPAMRARGAGCFVFVSSVNALSHHGNPAYSAAKAAVLAWMRALAVEEGRHGLRANAVTPASIRTKIWENRLNADPGILDRLAALYPLGRIVTTEEVANAVLFLASPLASGITGAVLNVDAGLMAGNLPFFNAIT